MPTSVNYGFDARRYSDLFPLDRTIASYRFDYIDSLDLQSTPSLMSPDPSRDHVSDSIEEDDEDLLLSPGLPQLSPQQYQNIQQIQYQMQQQLGFQSLQQQQQQQQQMEDMQYDSDQEKSVTPVTPLAILRPNHPMVLQRTVSMPQIPTYNTQRSSQHDQAQLNQFGILGQSIQPSQPQYPQQQQQQQQLVSLPQYGPNSPAYNVPGGERFMPVTDVAQCLSSLQLQGSAIPMMDHDMNLMNLGDFGLMPPYQVKSSESSVQSPVLPKASPSSRETSPSLSPNMYKRVSLSLPSTTNHSPSGASASASTSVPVSAFTSALPSASSSAPAPEPTSDPATPKRRRRVRPPTVKKPKKVKPTHFPCTVDGCDKVFSRAYNLTSHMKTHSSERPFVCEVCSLAFARRHDRERHVRLHTGEKPYSCNICGAGFMRNDALHRHQKLCGVAGSMFATNMYQDEDPGCDGGSGFAHGHSSSGTGMPLSL